MSRRRHELNLSAAERFTLEQMRDHHPKPYMRVKAAALLRIANGEPAYRVAMSGVLKPVHRETVYIWLNRYEQFGINGLKWGSSRTKQRFPLTGGRR